MSTAHALPINHLWSSAKGISSCAASSPTRGTGSICKFVDDRVREAVNYDSYGPNETPLGQEYLDYLEEGWDGEDARPIAYRTLMNAARFLSQTRSLDLDPEIAPETDGCIQLEWYVGPNCVFSISFGPSKLMSFSGIFGQDSRIYGIEDISRAIPETIWAFIHRIEGAARNRIQEA